jgi:glucose-6-phosphate 1-dehydrogenase
MQNHMLQVLTLVAMELPARQTEGDLHAAKLELLRSVRVLSARGGPRPDPDGRATPPGH